MAEDNGRNYTTNSELRKMLSDLSGGVIRTETMLGGVADALDDLTIKVEQIVAAQSDAALARRELEVEVRRLERVVEDHEARLRAIREETIRSIAVGGTVLVVAQIVIAMTGPQLLRLVGGG